MFLDVAQLALDIVGAFLYHRTDLELRFDYRNGTMGRRHWHNGRKL